MLEQGIYDKPHLRQVTEGILYRLRVGCPWRDVPSEFGSWNAIYKRFCYWSSKGKLMKVFQALVIEPDLEWSCIDSSSVRAHQHSAGARGDEDQGIGQSRGGRTTKIHLGVDAYGLPLNFELTGGQVHDCKAAPTLLDKLPAADALLADKGYDSQALRERLALQASKPIIPKKKNSKQPGNDSFDWGTYVYRHLVENAFARLKQFRALATRYDKLKRNFQGTVALACIIIWLPM